MSIRFLLRLLLAALLAAPLAAPRATLADTAVTVTVTGIEKPAGNLLAGIYTSPDDWLGANTFARQEVPVAATLRDGTLSFDISLPPGDYALSVFQDLNGNRTLDTNFMGIPTEASGSSNDAPARFGAPKFRDALFTVGTEPVALTIRMK